MLRKREADFAAGAELVWEVDPRGRTISVYDSPASSARICRQNEVLDGGDVRKGSNSSFPPRSINGMTLLEQSS
jgi:hypothetical protein